MSRSGPSSLWSRPAPLAALLAALVLLPVAAARAQQTVRVATYNIKFFGEGVSPGRLDNLKVVVAQLDADIVGLQEIDDRAALERLFDPGLWDLVIDDDSGDDQDVALAVRRPLRAVTAAGGLDAQDADFLFSGPALNSPFPSLFEERGDAVHHVYYTGGQSGAGQRIILP